MRGEEGKAEDGMRSVWLERLMPVCREFKIAFELSRMSTAHLPCE